MIIVRDMVIYHYNLIPMVRKLFYKIKRRIDLYLSGFRGYSLFKNYKIKVENDVCIPFPETVIFKGECVIKAYSQIKSSKKSQIILGQNTMICSFTTIEAAGGFVKIGDNVTVGEYSTIQGQGGVVIEDNVLLASHVHFISNHHTYEDITIPIKNQLNIPSLITIKENTWIGINVTILGGVTIGKNSVIGTGSVVKNSIPDFCVAVGNPARVVKKYDIENMKWIKADF